MNEWRKLSPDQALLLALAEQWLSDALPPAMRARLQPEFAAARQVLAAHEQHAAWHAALRRFAHWDEVLEAPRLDQAIVDTLQQALFERRQVDVEYHGKTSVVHPFGWATRNGIHYLAGTFWDYADPRWLAVHRVRAARLREEPADSRASPEQRQAFLAKPPMTPDDNEPLIEVAVEFPERLHVVLRERPPRGDNVIVGEPCDGYFQVTGRMRASHGLYGWLLGFNEQVRVLEPESLKRRLHPLLYDTLTGLLNRHEFERALTRRLAESRRTQQPLGLALIDLDHFGQTNKLFSHTFGDKVLRHAVARMNSVCRDMDTLARWGGEEFVLLLPGADCGTACAVAERVRRALADHPLPLNAEEAQTAQALQDNPPSGLRLAFTADCTGLIQTASLGVACHPPVSSTDDPVAGWAAALTERAAAALQQAKQQRNRVVGPGCRTHHAAP